MMTRSGVGSIRSRQEVVKKGSRTKCQPVESILQGGPRHYDKGLQRHVTGCYLWFSCNSGSRLPLEAGEKRNNNATYTCTMVTIVFCLNWSICRCWTVEFPFPNEKSEPFTLPHTPREGPQRPAAKGVELNLIML